MGRDEPRSEPATPTVSETGVCRGEARWTVAHSAWEAVAPGLPDEVRSLLAAPIVVSVDVSGDARGAAGRRGAARAEDDDEERQPERYPSPVDPCAGLGTRHGEARHGEARLGEALRGEVRPAEHRHGEPRPMFLAPAGLRPRALARHRV
ncbi:hypothetical protein GCM10023322_20330 [Rugosimonospora acidiphila]|uniref:Uncharacterized protein n=1 Tax=Rugosimonospora acidiphila TaxID=556531 RepID=A0ABP9RQ29_9ACTN